MKFLVTLCFFASAIMALATPPVIKESNNEVSDATTSSLISHSQELEAAQHISLDKRVNIRFTFRIPFGRPQPNAYQALQTTISFMMINSWYYGGLHFTGWLCDALRLSNHNTLRDVTVFLYEAATLRHINTIRVPAHSTVHLRLPHMAGHMGLEIIAYMIEN
ncbi:hypothetical protein C2857_003666 [Epichloe festucae Fl1]|uniref:Uncharacterized protein n=1 Tax=Epichloe festucae (strain Fl1) TaxID=877507 RepID=A0A7S9KS40_EPIFF|nr:hypothetical protein C2857_003666 [Epichloe festucae Fl1]